MIAFYRRSQASASSSSLRTPPPNEQCWREGTVGRVMDQLATALNAICPYYTMFPLAFPLGVLKRRSQPKQWVLDPFCGRGTTTFAARLLGLSSVGLDSNPLAAALAAAKLP